MLRANGASTRPKLVALMGIPRSTLYDALMRLVLKERVVKYALPRSTRGRPQVMFEAL